MEHEKIRLRVPVNPALLRWARERAALTIGDLAKRFPHYEQWEQGVAQPTLKQLEQLAQVLHAPIGYLFLSTPPEEPLPIPDFRTLPGRPERPSPDLLDTIYLCQQRQAWYRDFLTREASRPLPFIRSATIKQNPVGVAADIRRRLKFDVEERNQIPTWSEALRRFIEQVEAAGILVMVSGVVGNDPHRKLSVQEFRGFTLVDELAPLIFINATDSKSAQMFTLAHELAHLWLGSGGVSDVQLRTFPDSEIERWCNQVAAELLVPLEEFRRLFSPDEPRRSILDRLARHFKVSTLVILRRMAEAGVISREDFWQAYEEELEHLQQFERQGEGGGNFYHTLPLRVSRTFAEAVIISALEGQTLFREAYQILGIRKHETFQKFAETLGVR